MAEHQGFMLLYTESNKQHTFRYLAPTDDFDKLWERARAFVGPAPEGARTLEKLYVNVKNGVHRTWRWIGTDKREATVETLPILRE